MLSPRGTSRVIQLKDEERSRGMDGQRGGARYREKEP